VEQAGHRQANAPLRAWIPLISVVTLGIFALWFTQSETPFGIGNGEVPNLVGRDRCDATHALARRGLRWRFPPSAEIQEKAEGRSLGLSPDCSGDTLVRQSPGVGTDLGEGGVVVLITSCADAWMHGGGCQ
jgi:beta-lactam-binding protein with PASTA domain